MSRWRWPIVGFVGVIAIAIARPWTIRPVRSGAPAAFDGPAYVAAAWPRVQREAEETAIRLGAQTSDLSQQIEGRARFVKGTGIVTAVDRQSRVGLMRVRIPGRVAPVSLQVGPVLRGSAVRDALSFVRFTDFTNQFDYAAVANGLNDRVIQLVLTPLDLDTLTGHTIAFVGATTAASLPEPIEVVPVRIDVEAEERQR